MKKLALALPLALAAGAASASDLSIPHEAYTLGNGLEVILAPDHSTPIVYVNVLYHVGAKDEKPGLSGFAHLFEHLMFQGSENAPGEYFTPLQEIGGNVNGSTSFDLTQYHEEVPAEYLPLALFMESDRLGWFLGTLDQTKLDNQREVVKNERRQRYENPPYGEVYVDIFATMYPEGHPYHHMPIGSHEDLTAADLGAVRDFFATWYVPNNASLVISGDFETEEAKALVEQYFGPIPAAAEPEPVTEAEPVALAATKKDVQYDDVPEHKFWLVYHSPALYADGDAELDLLSSVLSDGKESRLYKALVKDQQIAKDVSAYQFSVMLGSLYVIEGTAAKGHTTDEVVAGVDALLAEVLEASPPTTDEVDAAKASYEVGFWSGLSTVSGKGRKLNAYNHHAGTPDYLATDLARYQSATAESVLEQARTTLRAPRYELHVLPESARPEPTTPNAAPEGGE